MKVFSYDNMELPEEVIANMKRFENRERYRKKVDGQRLVLPDNEEFLGMFGYSTPSPEQAVENKETSEMLCRLIDSCLSNREKEVVIHIFYDEWTQEQTAEVLGITQQSVNIYLKRALTKLKNKLDNINI